MRPASHLIWRISDLLTSLDFWRTLTDLGIFRCRGGNQEGSFYHMSRHSFSWPLHKICGDLHRVDRSSFLSSVWMFLSLHHAVNYKKIRQSIDLLSKQNLYLRQNLYPLLKRNLDCEILLFLFIFYHIRLQHFVCLFLIL